MTAERIPLMDPGGEARLLAPELSEAFTRVLHAGQYILGPEVAAFEREAATHLGVAHAVGVACGTDALELSLRAAGVASGDLVLTTPLTFFATVSAIAAVGAQPVFADVSSETLTLDPDRATEVLEGRAPPTTRLGVDPARIRAVVPVHLYGHPADMAAFAALGTRFGIAVIEDAAQAFGAEYRGRPVGALGELAAFSFFPSKNLGAVGDGGLVTTANPALAERVRMLRAHGSPRKNHHDVIGRNSRLDALQAALLRVKLPHVRAWVASRRHHAAAYDREYGGLVGLSLLHGHPGHARNLYTIRVPERRAALASYLAERGIETGIYYAVPAHLQPAVAALGYRSGDLPIAERACSEVLSLPMYPHLSAASRAAVIEHVRAFFAA